MSVSLRDSYFYLVSFVMLMVLVFGSYHLVQSGLRFYEPDDTYMVKEPIEMRVYEKQRLMKEFPDMDAQEIEKMIGQQIETEQQANAARQDYYRWRQLIESLTLIIIAFPIYRYHWRQVRNKA